MRNLTPEFIEKANAAKSAEELFELAKANNVEMTEDEAKIYFEQMSENATVSDEELDSVAGGAGSRDTIRPGDKVRVIGGKGCPNCGSMIYVFSGGLAGALGVPSTQQVKCTKCEQTILMFGSSNMFQKI